MNKISILCLTATLLAHAAYGCRLAGHYEFLNYDSMGPPQYSLIVDSVSDIGNPNLVGVDAQLCCDKGIPDVRAVYIRDKANLNFIPQGIHNIFPNFNILSIFNCPLKPLVGNELNSYPNLQWFALPKCGLKAIPRDLFKFNRKVQAVYFPLNNISSIGSGVFNGLPLQKCDLSSNQCIDRKATVPDEMAGLISAVNVQCPEPTTTAKPTTRPTTKAPTTPAGPVCWAGNFYDFVCKMKVQVDSISSSVSAVQQSSSSGISAINSKLSCFNSCVSKCFA